MGDRGGGFSHYEVSRSKYRYVTLPLMAFCSFPSNFVAVHELSKFRLRSFLWIVIITQRFLLKSLSNSEPATKYFS